VIDSMKAINDHPELFTEREQVALRYAEVVTKDAKQVDDGLWNKLRLHFDEGEIIELTSVIGLFNYFNRFNDALQVEVTK
jgi:alkylhydroperoxidase family enzyme